MSQKRTRVMSRISLAVVVVFALTVGLICLYPYPTAFPTLPKLTRTQAGAAGDPINVLFVGDSEHIRDSFQHARWLIPDPITPHTTAQIALDSLAHRPYPTAPISNLYVFGRAQDLAFEKPTTDVQNRGHIRLWQTSTRLGGQVVWVGQASYDHGIELSGTTHFPTHHIAPTVDLERNAVGTDLQATGLVAREAFAAFTPPIVYARNGGGDYYASDGEVLVITYTPVAIPLSPPVPLIGGLKTGLFLGYDALLTSLPLALGIGLVGLALVGMAVWPRLRWLMQKRRLHGHLHR